jgi:hypothetical protein
MKNIQLGSTPDGKLDIKLKTFQRHFACFGSSGSGKTVASKVLIEELAMKGVPVIAFDPQGDIASLMLPEEPDVVKKNGTDPAILKEFVDKVEVVVWTPGSSKGLPICINPLQFDGVNELSSEDRTRYLSATAKSIAGLVRYDLTNDTGKTAEAILNEVFKYSIVQKMELKDFGDVVSLLLNMPENVDAVVSTITTEKFIKGLIKKLNLLTLGSRKLIFQTGTPANIETLLGLDEPNGKTRISVIYLNTLHTVDEKEFFISSIAQALYRWMLKNPLSSGQSGVQCAMFIDEIAPYIPPVRKPACKESLDLLFRQGRKYGVSCLIATQSPGDIDYKAIGQFSTFTLGTLNTRQDIEKVKRRLESIAPKEVDYIVKKMPALQPGQFLVVSPDEFSNVQELRVRWLVTKHAVLTEDQLVEQIPNELREKYPYSEPEEINIQEEEAPTEFGETEEGESFEKLPAEDDSPVVTSMEEVLCVRNKVFERDLVKKIKPYLAGGLVKSEELTDTKFRYLPLVKVSLIFFQKKGVFKKTVTEIPENLYLDFKTQNLLYVKNNQFIFSSVVDLDPNKISDLDDHCDIKPIRKDKIDYDFRGMGGRKLNKKAIRNMMERKYQVKVNDVELLLFPTWECTVKEKKSKDTRTVVLDGGLGKEISR